MFFFFYPTLPRPFTTQPDINAFWKVPAKLLTQVNVPHGEGFNGLFCDSAEQANLTKLLGITYLIGKIEFKLLFHGPAE